MEPNLTSTIYIQSPRDSYTRTHHGISWLTQNFVQSFKTQSFHSTDFCLSYLSDKIWNGFDFGFLTGMILIDLQKTFDTKDYYILLKHLPSLWFSNELIDWFRSYLSSRKFQVNNHEKDSTTAESWCGVP